MSTPFIPLNAILDALTLNTAALNALKDSVDKLREQMAEQPVPDVCEPPSDQR